MPKKIWLFIIGAIIVVVLLPLGIDWVIIGNSVPSNISNSDWVGFLGGYIGAIIGCIISFAGILWTINFTREQNRADRELQIRPFFDFRYLDVETSCYTENWLGYVVISACKQDDTNSSEGDSGQVGAGLLYIKNVGNGPATNINFEVSIECKDVEYRAHFINKNTKVSTNSILPGEKAELSIDISNKARAPRKDDIIWEENDSFGTWDMTKFKTPENFVVRIQLRYNDLMLNGFVQNLVFDARYYTQYKKDEDAKYRCEMDLKQIDVPVITR